MISFIATLFTVVTNLDVGVSFQTPPLGWPLQPSSEENISTKVVLKIGKLEDKLKSEPKC